MPKRRQSGWLIRNATAGVEDYSNMINVPALSGYQMFDESLSGNPLMSDESDRFMFGAGAGRDGLCGAAFASSDIEKDARAANTCVDGHPEIEAALEMFERKTILACRDLWGRRDSAGHRQRCVLMSGARIFADAVPLLRDVEMSVTEIMHSESQERMLAEICAKYGHFVCSGQ